MARFKHKTGAIEYNSKVEPSVAMADAKKKRGIKAKKPSDLTDVQVKKLVYELAKINNLI
jgi:hypothetical protein